MSNWTPSKEDIKKLCDAILVNFVAENYQNSADYCIHCGTTYGNIERSYIEKGKKPPHKKSCPVLIAQDVLTGID